VSFLDLLNINLIIAYLIKIRWS